MEISSASGSASETVVAGFPYPFPAPDGLLAAEPAVDDPPRRVPERLLQCIWADGRIDAERAATRDGTPLVVLDPGQWNLEPGPDFLRAVIRLGDALRCGDVEIHVDGADWGRHGHARDPAYNGVVLHVALDAPDDRTHVPLASSAQIPELLLRPLLEAPLEQLALEIVPEEYPYARLPKTGDCAARLAEMSDDEVAALLTSAGLRRAGAKAERLRSQRVRSGPLPAFVAGLLDVLGYKANRAGCRRLAAALPAADLLDTGREAHRTAPEIDLALALEALLLGAAGLLPAEAPLRWDRESRDRVRALWSVWWQFQDRFGDRRLDAEAWTFAGIRPANHPQRRLAAAALFLARHPDPTGELLRRAREPGSPREAGSRLRALLTDLRHPYWDRHSSIGSRPWRSPVRLVGSSRAEDAVVNLFLPWLLTVAWARQDPDLGRRVQEIYAVRPRAQNNALLAFVARRIFTTHGRQRAVVTTACRQQGLLQIFHDFCLSDRSRCRACPFPAWLSRAHS